MEDRFRPTYLGRKRYCDRHIEPETSQRKTKRTEGRMVLVVQILSIIMIMTCMGLSFTLKVKCSVILKA